MILSGLITDATDNRPEFLRRKCFICELELPNHRFRWKRNKLFFSALADEIPAMSSLCRSPALLMMIGSSYDALPLPRVRPHFGYGAFPDAATHHSNPDEHGDLMRERGQ